MTLIPVSAWILNAVAAFQPDVALGAARDFLSPPWLDPRSGTTACLMSHLLYQGPVTYREVSIRARR
jgi:hypothetical protein